MPSHVCAMYAIQTPHDRLIREMVVERPILEVTREMVAKETADRVAAAAAVVASPGAVSSPPEATNELTNEVEEGRCLVDDGKEGAMCGGGSGPQEVSAVSDHCVVIVPLDGRNSVP